MGLLEIIKQAGAGAVEAGYPVSILFGVVLNDAPLEIHVDQRFTLTEPFLIVPERLTPYEADLKHAHGENTAEALAEPLVIRRGLEIDDKVLLLRIQGGQQFIVLDRW
ncbi:DUF2577 domain-containing protein [Paenibacillus solanacearum]|uniref:DUF2577 domain-containing protein n=1 Tax=Paenibacillus solanacearum TaxID=2048548 RepID=UPI001C405805|nr:DUF2577 domain-containing protein [Paenibacillus solanacearum]